MASVQFPRAQTGSFSGLANIHYNTVRFRINNRWVDVTGSNASGTADQVKNYVNGLATIDVFAQGVIKAGSSYGKAQLSTLNPATLDMKPGRWTIARQWPLVDVTGTNPSTNAADTEKHWEWGISTISGNAGGWVIADGPLYETSEQTLTLDLDEVGNITGTATVDSLRIVNDHRRGGPIPVTFNYRYNGGHTYTGTNFSGVFGTSVHDPVKDTITVDLDTGETISHAALLYGIQISNPATDGGPIPVSVRWRFDAADAA